MSPRRFANIVTASSILALGICAMSSAAAASGAIARSAAPGFAPAVQARTASANTSRDAFMQHLANGGVAPGAHPSEVFKNIDRAYPASCLGSPLQLGLSVNDPNRVQKKVTLYGDPLGDATEQAFHETVTVTVFRVPCSGGKSATLIEFDRPSGHSTTNYPVFPNVYGGKLGSGSPTSFALRLANDPNTFYASTFSYSPLANSDVFVLENFYNPSAAVSTQTFDFNQAFNVYVDNLNNADPVFEFDLPVYNAAEYAGTDLLPISGYMSTNWTSPTQGGEGIVMQIYDNGDSLSRTLAFAWFTYDANKRPFWLFGQANVPIGTTQITAQTVYYSNGTFAGSSTTGLTPTSVGLVTFKFPDCAHMNVAWNIDASTFSGPKGQGSALYARVADVNGLVCQ